MVKCGMYADILIVFFVLGVVIWLDFRIKTLENKLIIVIKALLKAEEFEKEVKNYHLKDAAERKKLSFELSTMLRKVNKRFEKLDPDGSEVTFVDRNLEDAFSNKRTLVKNRKNEDFR